ncbi:SRPBCC family protein [Cellulomonas sp. P5_C5]
MTTAIDTTTTIAAPPDAVWAALTDWSLASRWMPGVTAMSGPVAQGAVVTFTVRGKERTAVVDTLAAPRTLALLSRSGPVTAVYTYTLSGTADGTRLRLLADVEVGGALKVLAPVIRRSIAKEDGVQPERLRAVVEPAIRPAG